MLSHAIDDPRAWTAATIDGASAWYYPVPGLFNQEFPDVSACREALKPVRAALERGRGFAIIQGPLLAAQQAQSLYLCVGKALGGPFAQNVQGTMLYDVRDTGQDVSQGARFSVTNYESSFHTDNSFGTEVLDYVGLLCLQTAKSGGRSQVVSGLAVHNELLAHHPDVLATLYQPFHVDRRGGLRDGDAPTIQVPILQWDGRELLVRYLRYWIEAGHEKIGVPLTPAQRKALDVLDEVLKRRDLRVEFDLKPGQMYFINNRWTLHNRTAFEDHPEMARRRHLVRLWLRR